MGKIIFHELCKLWRKKTFLIGMLSLLIINFFLLVMTSRFNGDSYAGAYKAIGRELFALASMEEKRAFIEQLYARIDGIYTIDQIFRTESGGISSYSRQLRKENADVIQAFSQLYMSGNYLIYTGNLQEEYLFISRIKQEFDTIDQYPEYLENIQEKAGAFSQISIFKTESGDSFSEKSIRAQADAYAGLQGVVTDYFPEKGVMSALEFRLSDILLIASVLLMASILIREEKDSGMMALILTLPRGRGHIAAAKIIAVMVNLLMAACGLYGMNLLYYHGIYGLGDLARSVQSLPSLMACVWPLSVGGYLTAFLLVKWLGALIFALWLMLCSYAAKNIYMGWGIGFCFIGLNMLARIWIPGTGHWNFFKFVNLIGFLDTNELLGTYIQLYFFGNPVPVLWCGALGAFVMLLLSGTAFMTLYGQGTAVYASGTKNDWIRKAGREGKAWHKNVWHKKARHKKVRHRKAREEGGKRKACRFYKKQRQRAGDGGAKENFGRIYRHECYKLFRMNGAMWVFAAFFAFIVVSCLSGDTYVSFEEEIYRNYMLKFDGRVTEQTASDIQKENERFKPLYELEDAYFMGLLSSDEYESALQSYALLQMEQTAYEKLTGEKMNYLKQTPGAWLVYDTGYEKLFDTENGHDLYDMMLLLFVLILGCGGLFSMEAMTGMEGILASLPLGRGHTAAIKLRLSFICASVLSAASLLPRYIQTGQTCGFAGLLAPANSLEFFHDVPGCFAIYHMMLIQLFTRIASACIAVCLIHWLALRLKNTLMVYFICALALELCPVLELGGLDGAKWLSLWPLFHYPGILSQRLPALLAVLFGIAWLGMFNGLTDAVLGREIYNGKNHSISGNYRHFLWRRTGRGRNRF